MRIYAVIPTHNRHTDLAELLATIPHYVSVLIIDNASEPPVSAQDPFTARNHGAAVIRDEEQPPNLSRLWNIGLQWAEDKYRKDCRLPVDIDAGDDWAIAVLNDDVLLSPGLLSTLAAALVQHNVDIAFPGPPDSRDYINRDNPFPGTALRMTGWCFMVRGSSGLRADEALRWWCGDDDLQAQAVTHGRGSVRVGLRSFEVAGLLHKHPDESTVGALRVQTEGDMETFVAKWGQHPWLPRPSHTVAKQEDLPSVSGDLDDESLWLLSDGEN